MSGSRHPGGLVPYCRRESSSRRTASELDTWAASPVFLGESQLSRLAFIISAGRIKASFPLSGFHLRWEPSSKHRILLLRNGRVHIEHSSLVPGAPCVYKGRYSPCQQAARLQFLQFIRFLGAVSIPACLSRSAHSYNRTPQCPPGSPYMRPSWVMSGLEMSTMSPVRCRSKRSLRVIRPQKHVFFSLLP